MTNRGIIIVEHLHHNQNGFSSYGDSMPNLPFYVLYWDKIDWPFNRFYTLTPSTQSKDIQLLVQERILQRTPYQLDVNSNNFGILRQLFEMQYKTFQNKSRNINEEWSIAQPSDLLQLPESLSQKARTLEVEIYKAIPVPTRNTPLEKVLVFREKNKASLLNFRLALDEIYLKVLNSGDVPRAKSVEIVKLTKSLDELNRLLKESKINKIFQNIKIDLDVAKILPGFFKGLAIGGVINYPILGAISGVVESAISFKIDLLAQPKGIPNNLQPFLYLHDYKNQVLK